VEKFVNIKSKTFRQAVRFTHLIVSLWGMKYLGREANRSPSSTDVYAWTYTATAPHLLMAPLYVMPVQLVRYI